MISADTSEVFLCEKCANPMEVRTYCAKCHIRLRLTVQEAKDLFEKTNTGIKIRRSGLAMVYPTGCPDCTLDAPLPKIFIISDPHLISQPRSRLAIN